MPLIAPMPPVIVMPAVVEPYGVPEVFADGGIVHHGETTTDTVLYRRQGSERIAVLRIIMLRNWPHHPPEDGFEASLIRAYVVALGGVRH